MQLILHSHILTISFGARGRVPTPDTKESTIKGDGWDFEGGGSFVMIWEYWSLIFIVGCRVC